MKLFKVIFILLVFIYGCNTKIEKVTKKDEYRIMTTYKGATTPMIDIRCDSFNMLAADTIETYKNNTKSTVIVDINNGYRLRIYDKK